MNDYIPQGWRGLKKAWERATRLGQSVVSLEVLETCYEECEACELFAGIICGEEGCTTCRAAVNAYHANLLNPHQGCPHGKRVWHSKWNKIHI